MTDDTKDRVPVGGATPEEEDLLGPELRALLGSLPRALAPERDLTDEIATVTWDSMPAIGSIERDAPARDRTRARPWWRGPRIQLAAAAILLIMVSSATTLFLVRQQAFETDAPTTSVDATISEGADYSFAGYERIERDYADAIRELAGALEAQRDRLPPETVLLIEENLRVIDHAIEQSLAALRDAPQSLPLQQAVMTSYERKLDFLRQATAITADG